MICNQCGYDETMYNAKPFVGIFANGVGFSTTDGNPCGLYGCPICHAVMFTTDREYIDRRKKEYKSAMKTR